MKKINKFKLFLLVIFILGIVSLTIKFSYALFSYEQNFNNSILLSSEISKSVIESSDLVDDKIILKANEKKEIQITITNKNSIRVKKLLHYFNSSNNIVVKYKTGSSFLYEKGLEFLPNESLTVTIYMKNNSDVEEEVTFSSNVGFVNNDLVLENDEKVINQFDIPDIPPAVYNYTNSEQVFIAPLDGIYKFEAWGTSGGNKVPYLGGSGSYASGEMFLFEGDKIYVYVGGVGSGITGGYNGGKSIAKGQQLYGTPSGGATDFRLVNGTWNNFNSLSSRILVAASGGSANYRGRGYGEGHGGYGGGLIGGISIQLNWSPSTGYGQRKLLAATNNVGGKYLAFNVGDTEPNIVYDFGLFGVPDNTASQSGGGAGYYNGAFSSHIGAGGGSSYISGHLGAVGIKAENDQTPKDGCVTGNTNIECSYHYSNKIFSNTVMIDGEGNSWSNVVGDKKQMPNPNGGLYDIGVGHKGNGVAKITLVG